MIPDRVIVRKLREYDPYLFVLWNQRKEYFEVWRRMPHGRRLITPVTLSIYDDRAPMEYTPLDERVLWWLWAADGYRFESTKRRLLEQDQRWLSILAAKDQQWRKSCRDFAKDSYALTHGFYTTKHAKKNSGKPTFNKVRPYQQWVAPDVQARTSSRLFSRSAGNARAFGYRR